MLTRGLALLHYKWLLTRNKFVGRDDYFNNNGGGIFWSVARCKFEPPFEDFFATPRDIKFLYPNVYLQA